MKCFWNPKAWVKSLQQLPARPSLNITMSERGYYATDIVEFLLILKVFQYTTRKFTKWHKYATSHKRFASGISCGGSRLVQAGSRKWMYARNSWNTKYANMSNRSPYQQNVNCVSSIVVSKILRSFLKRSFLQSCTAAGRYFFLLFVFQATRRNNVTVIKVLEGCVSLGFDDESQSQIFLAVRVTIFKKIWRMNNIVFNIMQLALDEPK